MTLPMANIFNQPKKLKNQHQYRKSNKLPYSLDTSYVSIKIHQEAVTLGVLKNIKPFFVL